MSSKVNPFRYEPYLCTLLNGMLLDTPPRDMPRSMPMRIKPKEASQDVHGAKASRQEAWKRRLKKKDSASISVDQSGAAEPLAEPVRRRRTIPASHRNEALYTGSVIRQVEPAPPKRSGVESGAAERHRTTSAWNPAPPKLTAGIACCEGIWV